MLQASCDRETLCETLSARFAEREQYDIARIRRVVQWAEQDGCLTRRLLDYFGETRGDCGHCGRCEGVPVRRLPPARFASPGQADADPLRQLRAEHHDLATPRQLARFLCGLASPATTRAKLRKHALFGRFDSVPFREVLTFVQRSDV